MPTDSIPDIPSVCVNGAHTGWADYQPGATRREGSLLQVPEG